MFLKRLYIQNFRNYSEEHFVFGDGLNVIFGDNAQGKTNLLEAIHFLMTGHSFRPMQMSDLIKHQSPFFYLEGHFVKNGIDQRLRYSFDGNDRKIFYNNTPCPSATHLLGLLQGVMISPDSIELIKGSPQKRRHFLDIHIAQHTPLYVHHLTRYHRAMRQRNYLLKNKISASIETWEEEMAKAAGYVVMQRKKAIKELQERSIVLYRKVSAREEMLGLDYRSSGAAFENEMEIRNYYLGQYQKLRGREMMLGATLSGPQKDDMTILIDGNEARFYGSEGQQRNCITAIHLAEWERLKELTGETPLMLIDDLGTSLDSKRKESLLEYVGALGQVLVSSTESVKHAKATFFPIEGGKVKSV